MTTHQDLVEARHLLLHLPYISPTSPLHLPTSPYISHQDLVEPRDLLRLGVLVVDAVVDHTHARRLVRGRGRGRGRVRVRIRGRGRGRVRVNRHRLPGGSVRRGHARQLRERDGGGVVPSDLVRVRVRVGVVPSDLVRVRVRV